MTLKRKTIRTALMALITLLSFQNGFSQCFEIENILVDACGGQEGLNEMVRFKVGSTSINTSNLAVVWPNNSWQGLVQNSITASKTATLNADILDAGGCGQLIEPTGGVLPANATVILVTSYNLDTSLNSFGALTQNIYIVYQNNAATTSGHFANSGTGIRTLTLSFGACTDTVSYDRALLNDITGATVAADGATVKFTPAGIATYVNYGCSAPVDPFIVDAGPSSVNLCPNGVINLSGTAQGQQSVSWSASSGVFSNVGSLNTSYTLASGATGSIILTLTATNICGATVTDTITINVTNTITPNFTTPLTVCATATPPALNTTSPNGITGSWSPSVISTSASGNYIFTPNTGQCAVPFTLTVNITNSITPSFTSPLTLCTTATPPALNTTSPNGITGSWSPSVISTSASGNYIFTPNTGQCAVPFTLTVTITNTITPNFTTPLTLCATATPPALNTTSPNGISGSWSPSTISTSASGDYIFTPNAGQCAVPFTLTVTITNTITPNFTTPLTICATATPPALSTTSPNGITGSWSPSAISTSASGNYIFTPNAGQCAVPFTLTVTITNSITPNFTTPLTLCATATPPALNTTSPNGITGSWSPSVISTSASGDYIFTPNAGQCAVPFTLTVTITNSITPNFTTPLTLCATATPPALSTTSPNGISGSWSPSAISTSASGNYIFTPNAGQCAVPFTLTVNITNSITPNFTTPLTICATATPPALNTTSPNGISGSWSPSTISTSASGDYIFTPNAGQCAVPFTLTVNITNTITPNFTTPLTLCATATPPALNTTSPNGISGSWSPSTISTSASGDYIFTPNAGQCAVPFTLTVNITNSITPNFTTPLTLCATATPPALSTTSPNGISGSWSPSTISTSASGDYIFTPNAGQCAVPFTLTVTITNSITPNFTTPLTICATATPPALSTTSPNGITGSWSPSVISTSASGDYIFTPNAGQCAVPFTLTVNITNSITPNFTTPLTLCATATPPALNTTSPNGITGSWSPSAISTSASGNYIFTPNAGQCAVPFTLTVTITNTITPDFTTPLTICATATPPTLNTTSPNGITGSWSPSAISTSASGNYIFTPNAGQCAVPFTLTVNITNSITPNFTTPLTVCATDTPPALNTTSTNGITGSWLPSVISTSASGDYTFTPNAGQCAVPFTLTVVISRIDFGISGACIGNEFILTAIGLADSIGNVSYEWHNSQGILVGTENTLSITELANGTIPIVFPETYSLTITNTSGCSTTKNYAVDGIFCNIQKGISANNDGLNDVFDLSGLNVKELKIFNRYGAEVYSRRNYINEWSGLTNSGRELPDATYYYVIEKDDGKSITGWIYINRLN